MPNDVNNYVDVSNNPSVRSIYYLNLKNAHKMIQRFLDEKGMSKDELAFILHVKVKNLDQIFSKKIPPGLMSKINLPLVRLYCNTKW